MKLDAVDIGVLARSICKTEGIPGVLNAGFLVGFRSWRVSPEGLRALVMNTLWKPGQPSASECAAGGFRFIGGGVAGPSTAIAYPGGAMYMTTAMWVTIPTRPKFTSPYTSEEKFDWTSMPEDYPTMKNSSGYWAYSGLGPDGWYGGLFHDQTGELVSFGAVAGWGRAAEHEFGWRAEYATPIGKLMVTNTVSRDGRDVIAAQWSDLEITSAGAWGRFEMQSARAYAANIAAMIARGRAAA